MPDVNVCRRCKYRGDANLVGSSRWCLLHRDPQFIGRWTDGKLGCTEPLPKEKDDA